MAAARRCCVPNCDTTHDENTILHAFPHPEKEADRFRTCLYAVGGDILALDSQYIYKYRKVCHQHLETKYHTWDKWLSAIAIPTLNLKRLFKMSTPATTNPELSHPEVMVPSTSTGLTDHGRPLQDITN